MPTSARGRAMAPAPTMRDVSILGAPAEAQRRERALPRALRDGQLLTAPSKMPLACGQPVFRSTQFSVALLPGLRASYYISFAELIFTPGPMVEAHTQERMY